MAAVLDQTVECVEKLQMLRRRVFNTSTYFSNHVFSVVIEVSSGVILTLTGSAKY